MFESVTESTFTASPVPATSQRIVPFAPLLNVTFPLYTIALVGIVYIYYRMFSRNISRRSAENEKYMKYHYRCMTKFNQLRARIKDSKTHRIFKCPSCGQKIRVPKGKGRISIKCPKCRIEFIKKT